MAEKAESKKDEKVLADGFYKSNTVEIEVNGRKVRVFDQEGEAIKKKLAKKK